MLTPFLLEVKKHIFYDWHASSVGLSHESVDDDGYEQVQENVRYNNLEEYMERNRKTISTAVNMVRIVWVSATFDN